jgi:uncharacterized metal-binding protein
MKGKMVAPQCAKCRVQLCRKETFDDESLPRFCPMREQSHVIEEAVTRYRCDMHQRVYVAAAATEKESFLDHEGRIVPIRPRIREVAEFAQKLQMVKLGLAFCGGLSDEAARITTIFERHGFVVASVMCKCGHLDKAALGVPRNLKRQPTRFEAGCNPFVQAALLNAAGTELNVIVGLCIGHDILFTRNSHAPVTTLIVKDRLTGHSPSVSLYTSYHRPLL